jgi:hypothetical protein
MLPFWGPDLQYGRVLLLWIMPETESPEEGHVNLENVFTYLCNVFTPTAYIDFLACFQALQNSWDELWLAQDPSVVPEIPLIGI